MDFFLWRSCTRFVEDLAERFRQPHPPWGQKCTSGGLTPLHSLRESEEREDEIMKRILLKINAWRKSFLHSRNASLSTFILIFAAIILMINLPNATEDEFVGSTDVEKEGGAEDASNTAVWGTRQVEGADPETFEVLNEAYAKDAYYVYFFGESVKGVDLESFKVGNDFSYGDSGIDYFAEDQNYLYFGKEGDLLNRPSIVKADRSTFEELEDGYAKDKDQVFAKMGCSISSTYGLIVGANPETFETLGNYYASDENDVYTRVSGNSECSMIEKIEGADSHYI